MGNDWNVDYEILILSNENRLRCSSVCNAGPSSYVATHLKVADFYELAYKYNINVEEGVRYPHATMIMDEALRD